MFGGLRGMPTECLKLAEAVQAVRQAWERVGRGGDRSGSSLKDAAPADIARLAAAVAALANSARASFDMQGRDHGACALTAEIAARVTAAGGTRGGMWWVSAPSGPALLASACEALDQLLAWNLGPPGFSSMSSPASIASDMSHGFDVADAVLDADWFRVAANLCQQAVHGGAGSAMFVAPVIEHVIKACSKLLGIEDAAIDAGSWMAELSTPPLARAAASAPAGEEDAAAAPPAAIDAARLLQLRCRLNAAVAGSNYPLLAVRAAWAARSMCNALFVPSAALRAAWRSVTVADVSDAPGQSAEFLAAADAAREAGLAALRAPETARLTRAIFAGATTMRDPINEQYFPVPAYAKLPPMRERDVLGATGMGAKYAKRSVVAALATLSVVQSNGLPLQPFAPDAAGWLLLFEAVLHLNALDGPTGYEAMVGRLAAGLPAREQAAAARALGPFLLADLAPHGLAAEAGNSELPPGRSVLSAALLLHCHDVLLSTRAPVFAEALAALEARLRSAPAFQLWQHDKNRQRQEEMNARFPGLGSRDREPAEWSLSLPDECWLAWPLVRRAATAADSTASLRRQAANLAVSALKLARLWAAGSSAVPDSSYLTSLECLKAPADTPSGSASASASASGGSSSSGGGGGGGGGAQAGNALVAALAQQLYCVLASGWSRRKGFDRRKVETVLAGLLLPPRPAAAAPEATAEQPAEPAEPETKQSPAASDTKQSPAAPDPVELLAPSQAALSQAAAQLGVRICASVTCASLGGASELKAKTHACSGCKVVRFCCRECQVAEWPRHKRACKQAQAQAAAKAAAEGPAGE